MNGLVVGTMSFTGCARLNSNKDANNLSRLCGQGCESWPLTGKEHRYRCRRRNSKQLFRWRPCQTPQMTLCSLPQVPPQRTANKPKQMKSVSTLQLSAYNPTITSSHTSSSLKYFQREVGTVEDSASPKVFNRTYVRRRTPAFFQAVD